MSKDPAGRVEAAVRSDVEQLGDLSGIDPSLAEMAYTLAREIDAGGGDEGKQLPQLTRELRQTLAQLMEGQAADDDDDLGDLASPD
ncbi:hypothetical protein [Streptomyces sp. f150]|uniref:hypothetical protein n=1 Tax=Streptomyces sp. f150 TaxID=1827699 RepID=UPI000BF05ECB|nr:hypothetical protein [Streptomyces sp. f150]